MGENVPSAVDEYLAVQRVLQSGNSHTANIFVYQAGKRLDIEFNPQATYERIIITFDRETTTPRSSSCR